MACKVLIIIVVLMWTLVSGTRLSNVYNTVKTTEARLQNETLTRQEDVGKLSKRLDAVERLLFMEDGMEESLMLTQKLPEIIDNMRLMSHVMESLNDALNATTSALEQSEAKVTALSTKLDMHAKQMKILEDKSNNNEAIIKSLIKKPASCLSIQQSGQKENGVYYIYLSKDVVPVPVYCDMTTDGGGWTVFQRRQDGSVDFYRGLEEYKRGFGDVDGEFWLGNDLIAELTKECCHELRIDMADFDGAKRYAQYKGFKVSPESDKYTIVVSGYSGDAGNSLNSNNKNAFTTKDRDNDRWSSNCADEYQGAWWYSGGCGYSNLNGLYLRGPDTAGGKGGWWYHDGCHNSNLNGMYLRGPNTASGEGVNWYDWRGYVYSLKMTEMKLR